MHNQETESNLLERVDDLSTQLLLSGADRLAEFVTALAELARLASQAGYGEAAKVAEDLSGREPDLAAVQAGLVRLQGVLNSGPAPAESPKPAPPAVSGALSQDLELVTDFILETREHLATIEQRAIHLERNPRDFDSIHAIFRAFHSIKGLAGFLDFSVLQSLAHEVETALNLAREDRLAITSRSIDTMLTAVDFIGKSLKSLTGGAGTQPLEGYQELLARVAEMMNPEAATVVPDFAAATPATMPAATPAAQAREQKPEARTESATVRVDTSKLDYLVDMVGEMVIAQSLVRHSKAFTGALEPGLQRHLAQLARITGEVQRTAMSMRMVPIGNLFQRTKRQVRDLSRKVGKQVDLLMSGEDTQMDKTIAEQMADPLMHMVRNAIDHGIESPADREAAGKPATARVSLSAYHRAGQIVIEVSDDGRGMDPAKILTKARQKGLVAENVALTEPEILRLILEPGFSTAERITDISGRGVGMDVVRRQVEKLRGRIEIQSEKGAGTTFLLKLPLTLAIIEGLVVTLGPHRYIVPLFAVREMFRPSAASIFTVQNRQEMALVRGRLLPVLRLHARFGLEPRSTDPCEALLIVAESEGQSFCLMVDDLIGKQEVVIKSLGEGLGEVPGIAGGAILGDGRVGLILDMTGLWGARADS